MTSCEVSSFWSQMKKKLIFRYRLEVRRSSLEVRRSTWLVHLDCVNFGTPKSLLCGRTDALYGTEKKQSLSAKWLPSVVDTGPRCWSRSSLWIEQINLLLRLFTLYANLFYRQEKDKLLDWFGKKLTITPERFVQLIFQFPLRLPRSCSVC